MPKIALEKVSKKIRKKKGALDGLGDRNAARMNRASLRDQKLKHAAKVRNIQKEHESMRILSVDRSDMVMANTILLQCCASVTSRS